MVSQTSISGEFRPGTQLKDKLLQQLINLNNLRFVGVAVFQQFLHHVESGQAWQALLLGTNGNASGFLLYHVVIAY